MRRAAPRTADADRATQINVLFHKLLYVSQNEETSCLKLVHFYDDELGIPSEMDANWKSKCAPCSLRPR